MSTTYKVGIIGATGAVGVEMANVLHDRKFPVSELHLFASERSAGKQIQTAFGEKTIELFTLAAAQNCDFVLMAVSGDFAKEWGPQIAEKAIVIDNSSAWRYDPAIPLVVPEINPEKAKEGKLIANPNCTTAIASVALWPIHKAFGLKKVIVSTYQATSGAGAEGMEELLVETGNYLAEKPVGHKIFVHPIAFNLIPQIDKFQDNGYTKEEMKVTWELRKIFGEPELAVSCTAVRIPTLRAHSESITIETEKPVTPEAIRELLKNAPGVKLVDNPAASEYPMPLNASTKYDVEVGRIRTNLIFGDYGIDLFICGDQLLKGAALNAVQIAEVLI